MQQKGILVLMWIILWAIVVRAIVNSDGVYDMTAKLLKQLEKMTEATDYDDHYEGSEHK